ncbi:MAG: hypothetical protein V5A43_08340 [Haloarculaceae archaeon]
MVRTVSGTLAGLPDRANPLVAIVEVVVPVLALIYAITDGSPDIHTCLHVMVGVLWTGIDLFIAPGVGAVLGGLAVETSGIESAHECAVLAGPPHPAGGPTAPGWREHRWRATAPNPRVSGPHSRGAV